MMRSRSTVRSTAPSTEVRSADAAVDVTGVARSACACAADRLATVVPRDDDAEDDVEPTESGAETDAGNERRAEKSDRAEEKEECAHHRNDADRERAAGDDGRA